MKPLQRFALATLAMALTMSLARPLPAQSLAELARQARAKKQAAPGAVKTYTNDDIPVATISAAPAVAPAAGTQAAAAAEAPEGAPPAAEEAAAPPAPSLADLEKEYRQKFAALRDQLALEEKRLDVMQRELNLAQQQYYSDPNVTLREELTRAAINKRTAEIEAQRATVEKAKQAIADLEDELRRKSLPPGWAR
ncbi:MAG TPA: hypothetical protein VNN17_10105 [Terriglobia bacterium]|nr:hypothetical protein [Terriglobia bacterium]